MSPVSSDDLNETSQMSGDAIVLLVSPDTAEHEPAYREIARFPLP
jgi:hypothetical protein